MFNDDDKIKDDEIIKDEEIVDTENSENNENVENNEEQHLEQEKNKVLEIDVDEQQDETILEDKRIVKLDINTEVRKSFMAYAMAVNVSRAIPDIRDGLKPVHRRILYAMGDLGIYGDKPYKKCARIVGEVIGKYHPHGDTAVYDSLVRMAQDFTINAPLIDGQGNFGSIDGDRPAAMRYTESRLSKISGEMLRDIEKDTVTFVPNFDGSETQPSVLPARFPNLLVNGSDGIAVGMATNIPPHNLVEAINATIAVIDNPEIELEDLMEIIPAPDFPTRGIIMGRSGIRQAYETGRGSFTIRAKAEIEEYNKGTKTRIVITEIPYQVNKQKLILQIVDLVKNKKIEGISDIKEESDRTGMRVVIEVKRDANAQVLLNSLYKQTQLQISFGIIFLTLVDGMPKVINLKEYLNHYIKYQKEIIIKRTEYELDKAQAKAHILEGLVIAQANIDEVIKTIKQSSDKQEAQEKLVAMFELSEKQAIAILEMRLQRLTGLEVEKLKAELKAVEELISELTSILANESKVLTIIKGDLTEIANKYGNPRRSVISIDYGNIDDEDLIKEEEVAISLSHSGYIKRIPITEYRSQHRGGKGALTMKTKDEDFVENIFTTSTHNFLLCFSSYGRVYRIKGYEVPEASKNSKGRAVVNLLQLEQGERITAIIPLQKEATGHLMMATKRGLIKKTALTEFDSIRKSGKIAIKLNENDELISVYVTSGNDDIIVASSQGKCIRFNENNVRVMGRDTQGVKSMSLGKDEYIVDMSKIYEDKLMLTISENGYGKRSEPNDYRTQTRAGKGIKAGVFNEQTGRLINLKQVLETDDIMIIADDGNTIRIKASSINKIGRNTKGVKLMTVGDNAKIVGVAVVSNDETEEDEILDETNVSNVELENATTDQVENSDSKVSEKDVDVNELENEEVDDEDVELQNDESDEDEFDDL